MLKNERLDFFQILLKIEDEREGDGWGGLQLSAIVPTNILNIRQWA